MEERGDGRDSFRGDDLAELGASEWMCSPFVEQARENGCNFSVALGEIVGKTSDALSIFSIILYKKNDEN